MFMKPNKDFMSMFVGLMDGDGYIEIGPQKQYNKLSKSNVKSTIRIRLVIRLHKRDEALINYITEVLKTGSISNLNSINQIRLIFSKKDLVTVIIPLIKLYNLQFLNYNRKKQYNLLIHILENRFIHWKDVNFIPTIINYTCNNIIKLDFFDNWLVGFTMAEGSFGIKTNGSAFFQIKQKGKENYEIIKAICLTIAKREAKPIKADSADCYQLTLSSKTDIQKVIDFFSFSVNHSLFGYKLKQYNLWLASLKIHNRYKNLNYPNNNNLN